MERRIYYGQLLSRRMSDIPLKDPYYKQKAFTLIRKVFSDLNKDAIYLRAKRTYRELVQKEKIKNKAQRPSKFLLLDFEELGSSKIRYEPFPGFPDPHPVKPSFFEVNLLTKERMERLNR